MKGIRAKIPEPNGNITMTMGNKVLVESVFEDTGLNEFLDDLKREQGDSVSKEVIALVANCVEMTGISVRRIDRILDNDVARDEYGLSSDKKSIYRTVERIGRNSDLIVRYLGTVLKERYGINMEIIFIDWTSMYFEAPPKDVIRMGYSRDKRPDRPQVTVGLSIDKESGMPVGLTIMPGNTVDVTHFRETFEQIRPLLPKDAMIIFDNGAYSKENAEILDQNGLGFITRLQMNGSDLKHSLKDISKWIRIDDDLSYFAIDGSLKRKRFIFRSEKLRAEKLERYVRKADRDYDKMVEIKAAVDRGKQPRKKYRVGNCFVDTKLNYKFLMEGMSREDAINEAVRRMTTGNEGFFMLLTNRPLTASETLHMYRSRNAAENAFRDLKHGINWRPARCTSEDAVNGRILISFLALFCISMLRFLYPEFKTKTAESVIEELSSFSLTVGMENDGKKRRIWSNFTVVIMRIIGRERPVLAPKVPQQAVLGAFG